MRRIKHLRSWTATYFGNVVWWTEAGNGSACWAVNYSGCYQRDQEECPILRAQTNLDWAQDCRDSTHQENDRTYPNRQKIVPWFDRWVWHGKRRRLYRLDLALYARDPSCLERLKFNYLLDGHILPCRRDTRQANHKLARCVAAQHQTHWSRLLTVFVPQSSARMYWQKHLYRSVSAV